MKPRAIKLRSPTRTGWFAIIHPAVRPDDNVWRISFFDDEGAAGHTSRSTLADAVKVAVGDGYLLLIEVRR